MLRKWKIIGVIFFLIVLIFPVTALQAEEPLILYGWSYAVDEVKENPNKGTKILSEHSEKRKFKLRKNLEEMRYEIDKIPAIDTHEHILPPGWISEKKPDLLSEPHCLDSILYCVRYP